MLIISTIIHLKSGMLTLFIMHIVCCFFRIQSLQNRGILLTYYTSHGI